MAQTKRPRRPVYWLRVAGLAIANTVASFFMTFFGGPNTLVPFGTQPDTDVFEESHDSERA